MLSYNQCYIGKNNEFYIFWVFVCSLRYPSYNAPCCHLWPALLYNIFSTLSHNRHDFRERYIENKMCVLIFSTKFVWNIFRSKKNWASCGKKICIGHHVKNSLFLSNSKERWIFSTSFRRNTQLWWRRGRRRKKLLDDLKDRRGYSHLKEEALDRTMWRNRFGRGFGPVGRQNTE